MKFPSDLTPDINLWFDCFAELMKFFSPKCYFSRVDLITLKKWSLFKTVTFENCHQGISFFFFSVLSEIMPRHIWVISPLNRPSLLVLTPPSRPLWTFPSRKKSLFTCGWLVKRLSQLRIPEKSQHYPKVKEKEPLLRFSDMFIKIVAWYLCLIT